MEKIKLFLESEKGKDALVFIIIILVGFGSFELGRLSSQNNSRGIKIEYPSNISESPAVQEGSVIKAIEYAPTAEQRNKGVPGRNYFASSRGTKYYSIGCSAGKTIKMENRVYFDTQEEAEKAGYTLSSSCN